MKSIINLLLYMLDSQLCWSDIQANFVGLTNVLSEWNLFVRRGLTVHSVVLLRMYATDHVETDRIQ